MPTPVLVFDKAPDHESGDFNFRLSSSVYMISASAQPNEQEIVDLLIQTSLNAKRVWYVNLRDESTVFIDGEPVSVYTGDETANVGKSREDIIKEERALAASLESKGEIEVHRLRKNDSGVKVPMDPESVEFKTIETEEQIINRIAPEIGIKVNCVRICILDHDIPAAEEIDFLVKLIHDQVSYGDAIHFHCHGGKGRSSTLVMIAKALCHAEFKQNITNDIEDLKSMEKVTRKDSGDTKEIVELRAKFIENFQKYIDDSYPQMLWSEWLRRNKPERGI